MSQLQSVSPSRAERRIAVQLQMQIEGEDATEGHFCQAVTTIDISRIGARLAPFQRSISLNSLLDVQFGTGKVRCRVVWLGKTPEERGQIGIRCLDESHVPWSHLLAENESTAQERGTMENNFAEEGWPSQERRRAPRYSCNILVNIQREGDSFTISARMIDLSLTGGYLETMSPFPIGTVVKLALETGTVKIPVTAVVRTAHPAMGNGVAFTKIDVEALQLLQKFLVSLGAPSPRTGQANPDPGTQEGDHREPDAAEKVKLDPQIEALVELLEKKSILNRQELLLHLQRKRS